MLDQGDIEAMAGELYGRAGHTGDCAVAPFRLVVALLGDRSVRRFRDDRLRADAYVCRIGQEWRVYVRDGLSFEETRFNLAHELAEWALREHSELPDDPSDRETCADKLAAALLAPRRFAVRAVRARGPSWGQLALDFGTTESCAALRFSEVTTAPLALVTPDAIRVRGEVVPWPDPEVLRSRGAILGLSKTRLRDDRRRFVLRPTG